MATLADFHRAVQNTLTSKRLGTPVFVCYLYHRPIRDQAAHARLAKTTAVVRDWMGVPLERILAQSAARHITLLLEFRGGPTAVVTWVGTQGRGDGVDLTVVGNHGALYHDAGDGYLWDEPLSTDDAAPDKELLAWIDRAVKSGQPEDAKGGAR